MILNATEQFEILLLLTLVGLDSNQSQRREAILDACPNLACLHLGYREISRRDGFSVDRYRSDQSVPIRSLEVASSLGDGAGPVTFCECVTSDPPLPPTLDFLSCDLEPKSLASFDAKMLSDCVVILW